MKILYLHRVPETKKGKLKYDLWRSEIKKHEIRNKMYDGRGEQPCRWVLDNNSSLFTERGMYHLAMSAQKSFMRK